MMKLSPVKNTRKVHVATLATGFIGLTADLITGSFPAFMGIGMLVGALGSYFYHQYKTD